MEPNDNIIDGMNHIYATGIPPLEALKLLQMSALIQKQADQIVKSVLLNEGVKRLL